MSDDLTFMRAGYANLLAERNVLRERVERYRLALQAIADAEPATISYEANWTYEAPCDGCQRLIAMAREGLEASE